MRRPVRVLLPVLAALSLAVGATACSAQTQPREYGEQYEKNFMIGCTGVEPNDEGQYRNPDLGTVDYCRCVYRNLEEKVPFDDVKAFEEQQAEESAGEISVPRNINSVYTECKEQFPGEGGA